MAKAKNKLFVKMKSVLKNGNWVLDVIQHEIERSASFGRCIGGNLDWNYFLWMRNRTFHWRSKRDKMRAICFDTFLFMNGVWCVLPWWYILYQNHQRHRKLLCCIQYMESSLRLSNAFYLFFVSFLKPFRLRESPFKAFVLLVL